ncbi:MAG: thiamine-phosphate kinase [Desulfuromonas sp.]|nr:MAG: thiamine-phosphate kinase [Desulfuromonas sp.]
MGGVPRHLYLGLGLPATATVSQIEALAQGIAERLGDYGMVLVGGDTCRSPGPLMLSVTVVGSAPKGEALRRSGACPGDRLYVSGTLGASALALQRLLANEPLSPELAQRHHDPEARVALGRGLSSAGLAHAMIDLSDGLIADLGHICRASAVGARIELGRLPLCADLMVTAASPLRYDLALSGGEDYELLAAIPPEKESEVLALAEHLCLPLSCVGEVTSPGEPLQLIGHDGLPLTPDNVGFNHFAATEP